MNCMYKLTQKIFVMYIKRISGLIGPAKSPYCTMKKYRYAQNP